MIALCIVTGLLTLSEVCFGAVTPVQRDTILAQHNQLRARVRRATNMQTMYWHYGLAAKAQALADTCKFDHNSVRTADFSSVGQNIARGIRGWKAVLGAWGVQEKANFIFGVGKGKDNVKVGHYTQMVWATTNNIGCGYNHCNGQRIYVCNYGPAGNILGRLYKPYKKGNSRGQSECGASLVDLKHPTLCDTQGKVCSNRRRELSLQSGRCVPVYRHRG